MSTNSSIQWTDATWNPIVGCSRVSAGCRNCYAETMAGRLAAMNQRAYQEVVKSPDGYSLRYGPKSTWNGKTFLVESALTQPLHWKKPRRVFVCSMSDLFHEANPFGWIDKVFAVMALCPQHTFQVLTKRPERLAKYVDRMEGEIVDLAQVPWPLPNVWLGTSVENQKAADERIPHLLRCRAAVRFLSVEPMLWFVDLTRISLGADSGDCLNHVATDIWTGAGDKKRNWGGVHWVIVGGESGPKARPCNVEWVRSIVCQCKAAGVPVFVKQLGAAPFDTGCAVGMYSARMKDQKGGDIAEWPEDLRVREFPKTTDHGLRTTD